jgi:DNA-binding response OmpR family regulator
MAERHTILLADDDVPLQATVKRVADALGHRMIQTTSGSNVLQLALESQPDLIVLDLTFDDADGRDILSRLKRDARVQDIPVLVWSGRTDTDSKRIALELGAEDYVEKHDAQTMLRKAERVLLNSAGPKISGMRISAVTTESAATSEPDKRTG